MNEMVAVIRSESEGSSKKILRCFAPQNDSRARTDYMEEENNDKFFISGDRGGSRIFSLGTARSREGLNSMCNESEGKNE